jgi:hypothetical protein
MPLLITTSNVVLLSSCLSAGATVLRVLTLDGLCLDGFHHHHEKQYYYNYYSATSRPGLTIVMVQIAPRSQKPPKQDANMLLPLLIAVLSKPLPV